MIAPLPLKNKKLMKNFIYIFFLLVIGFTSVQAQPAKKNWDKIEALKSEFILNKLELSSNTKNEFVPVYNAYQKELRQLYQLRRKQRDTNKNNPEKQVDDDFNFEARHLEVKKSYRKQFQTILSPAEIKTLYSAERQFKEELINQLKKKN